jgi:hypothetical protein
MYSPCEHNYLMLFKYMGSGVNSPMLPIPRTCVRCGHKQEWNNVLQSWEDKTVEIHMKASVVEAPEVTRRRGLFLGGGISGTANWQTEAISRLQDLPIVIYNPRRANFDLADPSMTIEQIEWEYRHLRLADDVLFYFPETSICPITLFELGAQLMIAGKCIFVGMHPDYPRRVDVEVQTRLIRPDIQITYGLDALMTQVRKVYSAPYEQIPIPKRPDF